MALAAQKVPPREPEANLAIQQYGAEHGLPSDNVYALAQDQRGFLWMGTDAGLVRFDGQQFVRWRSVNDGRGPGNRIRILLATRDGSVWAGLVSGGVSRIAGGIVRNFSADGFAGGYVTTLAEAKDGGVWAGSRSGLARFTGRHWEHFGEQHGLPRTMVNAVFEDSDGVAWVATRAGLYKRDRQTIQFRQVSAEVISRFARDGRGSVWANGASGLTRFGNANAARFSLDFGGSGGQPTAVLVDSKNAVWIGTQERGLFRASIESETIAATPAFRSVLGGEAVNAMIEDRDGDKWLATSKGLYRMFERRVTMVKVPDAPRPDTLSITRGPDGAVWIGTRGGLVRAVTTTASPVSFQKRLADVPILGLSAAPTGVWFATSTNVGLAIGNRLSTLATHSVSQPFALAGRSQHDIWLCAAFGARVHRWHDRAWTSFGVGNSGSRACTAVLIDRGERVWIGLDDGGLWVGEPNAPPVREVGATGGRVCALHEDDAGTIWAATNAGLGIYRGGQFVKIGADRGLPEQVLTGLQEDSRGNLWLGTERGLLLVARAEIERAMADKTYKVRYRMFDAADGLEGTPTCQSSPSSAVDSDGRVWFTTTRGFAVVDPALPARHSPVVTTNVSQVIADDASYPTDSSEVRLKPRTSKLEFHYGAASVSAGSRLRFQYKLEGFDTQWVEAGLRRQAFYTNLQPGHYRFAVRTVFDGTPQPPAAWTFVIPAAFYETRTFFLLAGLATALATWLLWRIRLRSMRRRFQIVVDERTRIAREIHDTVLQSMAGAALELEGLALDGPSPGMSDVVRRIRRRIEHTIADARRSILDLRSPVLDTQRLEDALEDFAAQFRTRETPRVKVSTAGTWRRYPHDIEEELLRVGQEAVTNAVRHGRARQVTVLLSYEPDGLRLTVSDDGCGLPEERVSAVGLEQWGLKGMQERITRIGGRFRVSSSNGEGTEIQAWVSAH